MTPTTLSALIQALRHPVQGCPWDLKQDHQTLAKCLREEAGEVLDALAEHEPGDAEKERHLCEELGDLWLQVVFHAQLARERGAFDLGDVERMVVEKLIRRHPHVFGDVEVRGAEDVLTNWAAIKTGEKAARGEFAPERLLDGIPAGLSPMDAALEIGKRCAKVGFEWPDMEGVVDKVREEFEELQAESEPSRVESEFGDVLFSLLQWARYKGVDPDRALRRQMRRFRSRFEGVETYALNNGGWEEQDLDRLEAAWQAAKRTQAQAAPDRP